VSFEATAKGVPWDLGMKFGVKKLKSMGYPTLKTARSYNVRYF